ncbi:MAG: nucleotidyltransferase [Chloroflexi bacterium]|nr:nucleotidyltransferase [Chloroflexota bacterium]
MGYLEDVLAAQQVTQADTRRLQVIRDQIQQILMGGWKTGDPRFYYGGSYAKRTMIRESFDLDLVVYFPPSTQYSVKDFYQAVEKRLRADGRTVNRHNVALRLPYKGGFHVDVVPGKAVDRSYKFANLYSAERDTTKRTSIKVHIDQVRGSGHQDVIKLMKLWRLKHNVAIGSFPLEIAVIRALKGFRKDTLADRTYVVLEFLRDQFATARLVDPANSNNIVSDEIPRGTKLAIQSAARKSCDQQYWKEIV